MNIIDRYIGLTVARSTLTVMFILLALFTFFTFADELNKIKGSYGALQALEYAIITMPRTVYQLFPAAALIGTMLGLGILASGSELTAMRAAGVSFARIVWAVMKFALVLMVIAFTLGEWVAPEAERYAETMRSLAQSERITLKTESGLWVRDGTKFINIGEIRPGGHLRDVRIFSFDEQQKLAGITRAEEAFFQNEDQWRLEKISRTNFNGVSASRQVVDQEVWDFLLSPALLDIVLVKPETMSAMALYQYAEYLSQNNIDARRYVQAFWTKIMSPLATATMVLLAVPFIFGPLRSVSAGNKILVGTLVGISFHLIDQVVNFVGLVYRLQPVLAATLPTLVFMALAIWGLRRAR